MTKLNGNAQQLPPGPMFPIPIELMGVRVILNGDGTVSGETDKFLKMAKHLIREPDPRMGVITWLMVNAIRREAIASAEMSARISDIEHIDTAKGDGA